MASLSAADAKKLQELLNKTVDPKPPLEVDGIVGKLTIAALKQLQGKAKISQSGKLDDDTIIVIERLKKTGKIEKEEPRQYYYINNKWVGLTAKEYAKVRKSIISNIKSAYLLPMRQAVGAAEVEWEHFDKLNKDQWFVSFCIETTRGVDLPKKSMISNARKALTQMESYVTAGNFAAFHAAYPKAETVTNGAMEAMRRYRISMIEGGENWVTGLNVTKTVSFTFVGVFAAPVTAGALGTGVVASALIGGAAVAATESAANQIGNLSAGQENWTVGGALKATMIDAAVGAFIGFLAKGGKGGKHIFEAAVAKLLPKIAAQTGFKLLSKETMKKVAVFMFTEGGKGIIDGIVKDVGKAAKGDKKMTMDQFLTNIVTNFAKGLAMGPLGKVIEKFAKKGADHLAEKDKQRIWDAILKELSKQSKGETIHISKIDDRTKAMVESVISTEIKKTLDTVVADIFSKWKGTMSPGALEKALREELVSPARIKVLSAVGLKQAKKTVKLK